MDVTGTTLERKNDTMNTTIEDTERRDFITAKRNRENSAAFKRLCLKSLKYQLAQSPTKQPGKEAVQ